jgi:hypothetical protein
MSPRLGRWVAIAALLSSFVCPGPVRADERTERLIELLRNSGNYRVRVQSAQSLGRIRDPSTVEPLVESLRDEHPAVRAAAALALGRIGSAEAVPALRRLVADQDQPAEVVSQAQGAIQQIQTMSQLSSSSSQQSSSSSGETRFYIGVGEMGNTTGRRTGELEKTLERLVRDELGRTEGVKLAPAQETPAQTKRALQGKGWTGYFVQGSVTRLEAVSGQIHAVISIMILSNPERDLRMMLQGRGTAAISGQHDPSPAEQRSLEDSALEGAVRGAISRLSQQLTSRP